MEVDNFIYKKFIDTNICDELINHYEKSPNKIKGNFGHGIAQNTELKQSTEIDFRPQDGDLFNRYIKELHKVCEAYKNKYIYSDIHQQSWGWIGSKIQKYRPNEGYHIWHAENTGKLSQVNRHLVFMTYLNTVNNGGETGFFYQNLKIKPEKGLTLIWPAAWTHTHKGHPSPNENKYILTGWYGYL